jgi:hypothetical protein
VREREWWRRKRAEMRARAKVVGMEVVGVR